MPKESEPKYEVLGFKDKNQSGCDVDATYDTLKEAKNRGKYWMTEEHQRLIESSVPISYVKITNRFTGDVVWEKELNDYDRSQLSNRVRIFVHGGCVTGVFSTDKNINVEVIDEDNVEEDPETEAENKRKADECETSKAWHQLDT